jgi:mRNA-degrading endonuclease RelE of RelBE toxin-antitoxin system
LQVLRCAKSKVSIGDSHLPCLMQKWSRRAGLWKYRVGHYRMICEIQDEKVTVLVVRIGHRREIYR